MLSGQIKIAPIIFCIQSQGNNNDERRKILENWAGEIEHILESAAENILVQNGESREEKLLQKINNALNELDGKDSSD